MPALQVRDFSQRLYEELRSFSTVQHRSMAQQTIAAVDAMIHGAKDFPAPPLANGDTRKEKRSRILERAAQRRQARKQDLPLPAEMIHAARTERDQNFNLFVQEHLDPTKRS